MLEIFSYMAQLKIKVKTMDSQTTEITTTSDTTVEQLKSTLSQVVASSEI
jgi:hypothetical protein